MLMCFSLDDTLRWSWLFKFHSNNIPMNIPWIENFFPLFTIKRQEEVDRGSVEYASDILDSVNISHIEQPLHVPEL